MARTIAVLLALAAVAVALWMQWASARASAPASDAPGAVVRDEPVASPAPRDPEASSSPSLEIDRVAASEPEDTGPELDPTLPEGRSRLIVRLISDGRPLPGCTVRVPRRRDVRVEIGHELGGAIGISRSNGEVSFQVPASTTIPLEVAPFGLDVFERWSLGSPPERTTDRATILVAPTGLDWMDLIVVETSTGEPLPGVDVKVRVTDVSGTEFDGRSGPNGIARIPAPRHGVLTATKRGYTERRLTLGILDAPISATLALAGTAEVFGQIPAEFAGDYDWAEVTYCGVRKQESRDEGLELIAPAVLDVGYRVGLSSVKTFVAEGRLDASGAWRIADLPLLQGYAAIDVEIVRFAQELDTDFLDDSLAKPVGRRERSRSAILPNERRRGRFYTIQRVEPGTPTEVPFPADASKFERFEPPKDEPVASTAEKGR